MLAAWHAMCELQAASALPFGLLRVFTQSEEVAHVEGGRVPANFLDVAPSNQFGRA